MTTAIDHSLTYKSITVKNLTHILRLRTIKNLVQKKINWSVEKYADVGCSNGYITDILARQVSAKKTVGFDYSESIEIASRKFPNYEFEYLDITQSQSLQADFDLVTCFETLEHVGNTYQALLNIKKLMGKKSVAIISIPIEIGAIGLLKYLIKRFLYRYELPLNCGDFEYFKALISGKDISQYRRIEDTYGSHFGFDYRSVDAEISKLYESMSIQCFNKMTTRFYIIENKPVSSVLTHRKNFVDY